MPKKKKKYDKPRSEREPRSAQQAIRHARLKLLIAEAGSHAKLAEKCHFPNAQYISQMWTLFRGISDESALKLQEGMGKPRGWMDMPADEVRDAAMASEVFEPNEAATLKKLLGLPASMRDSIILVIDNAHEMHEALERLAEETA